MTDSPSPRPRPRPAPGPAPEPPAAPVQQPAAAAQRPAPAQQPTPAPEPAPPAAAPAPGAPAPAPRTGRRRAAKRAAAARVHRLRVIMLAALVVAVLAAAASVLVAVSGHGGKARANSSGPAGGPGPGAALDDPDQVTAFLAGASSDIAAVTSYDYRRLDDALSAGSAVTTGAYRQSFRSALTGSLAAAARADRVTHDFEVLDLGIGQLNAAGTEAQVLIFGRQLATDKTHPQPQATLLTLAATIERHGDRYLISDLQQDAGVGSPRGTAELARAVDAGRSEVLNALTYTRAGFAADLQRALAGAANPLRAQLAADAAATRQAMAKGGYDLSGSIVAVAVKGAAGASVDLLVAADSAQVSASGRHVTPVRYTVSVTAIGSGWKVSRIQALAAQ